MKIHQLVLDVFKKIIWGIRKDEFREGKHGSYKRSEITAGDRKLLFPNTQTKDIHTV